MNNNSKIVIVGAGLAGSSCGYFLTQIGMNNVTIIEKQELPREKLCGGIVSYKSMVEFSKIFDETEISNLIKFKHEKASIFSSKNIEVDKVNIGIVDRKELDYALTKKFIVNGGQVIHDTVISVDKNSKVLHTLSGDIKYDILIAADGVNSVIRNYSYKKQSKNFAMEVFIDNALIKKEYQNKLTISFQDIVNGYYWIIPRGDKTVIGVGDVSGDTNIKEKLDKFICKVTNITQKIEYKGAFLPTGKDILLSENGSIFYIGDACGIISPITGEGIYYSIKTAKYIAESITDKDIFKGYNKKCKRMIQRVKQELFLNKFIYNKKIQNFVFKNSDNKYMNRGIMKVMREHIIN